MEPRKQHGEEGEPARPAPTGQAPGGRAPRRKRAWLRHCGRGARLGLELAAALTAGLAIAVALLIWRLNSGPISLDYVTPWLEQALSEPGGTTVKIEHTELTLDTTQHTLNLFTNGVRLRRREGNAEVALPRARLNFSVRAALAGEIAPTLIELTAPQLQLERAPDGTIRLGLGEGTGSEVFARDLFGDLAELPTQKGPLGYLREVAVRDGVLALNDRALGITWQANHVDITVHRDGAGLTGEAQVTIAAGDQQAKLHSQFRYVVVDHRLTGGIDIADLRPAGFAAAAAVLAPLAAIHVPISGRLGFSIDATTLHVAGARADLMLGKGSIDRAELAGGTLAIAGGAVRLDYDPIAARLAIETVKLNLGGPEIELKGTVDGLVPEFLRGGALSRLDVAGNLAVRRIPIDDLSRLWPEGLSPSSRSWVTGHIHDGTVGETLADLHATVDLAPGAAKRVQVDSLRGTIAFSNLTVDYLPPLPPVRGIDGTGSFDRTRLDLLPVTGTLEGLRMTGGTIKLSKLDTNDETIAIEVPVSGPLHDALDVIDTKPLQYPHRVGIEPSKIGGFADAQLSFQFPLIHDLRIDQVELKVRANLTEVSGVGLALGHDLAKGNLELQLDRSSMRISGSAEIDQVPATLSWMQSLKAADAKRYTVKARLDDAARKRFGFDYLPDYLAGPVDVDLDYAQQKQGGAAKLALDLKDATLTVDKLDWTKWPGTPATATAVLDFTDGRLSLVSDAVIAGSGIDVALSAAFSPGTGDLDRLDVKRLALGNTDAQGSLVRQPAGGWAVTLVGKSLDATHLVTDQNKSGTDRSRPAGQGVPIAVTARLDRVILGPDREARDVTLRYVDDGTHWQTVVADATLRDNGKVSVRFGEPAGDRSLKIVSNNLGAMLQLLDVSDNVKGGTVTVTGEAEDRAGRRVFAGRVDGEDYSVVKAPLFARLLQVASLSGISALLNGGGVPFTHLVGNYVYDNGIVTLAEARAYGGAIGINVAGTVDIPGSSVDLSGTLVPANTINNVLGYIPKLGNLVQGGEGQGMFAANFRIAGPMDNAQISVNPLSVLAPGFLRNLFLFDAPNPHRSPSPGGPSGNTSESGH